jgi:hypothetical protein
MESRAPLQRPVALFYHDRQRQPWNQVKDNKQKFVHADVAVNDGFSGFFAHTEHLSGYIAHKTFTDNAHDGRPHVKAQIDQRHPTEEFLKHLNVHDRPPYNLENLFSLTGIYQI